MSDGRCHSQAKTPSAACRGGVGEGGARQQRSHAKTAPARWPRPSWRRSEALGAGEGRARREQTARATVKAEAEAEAKVTAEDGRRGGWNPYVAEPEGPVAAQAQALGCGGRRGKPGLS